MQRVSVPVLFVVLTSACVSSAKPREKQTDLVEVGTVVPDAILDLRYATANNFMKAKLYASATCKLRRSVVARLSQAAKLLRQQQRRLVIWDCYRPLSVQKAMWKQVHDERYVADPAKGSNHNRGAAVDVGLADEKGTLVPLPTAFDDFTEAAHRDKALAGDSGVEARRLEEAMKQVGFVPMPTEWWHFDAPDASTYSASDEAL